MIVEPDADASASRKRPTMPALLHRSRRSHLSRKRNLMAAMAAAVVGASIHDLAEFGSPAPLNTGVMLVFGALSRWRLAGSQTRRPFGAAVVAVVAGTFLVGGAIGSVLPLPIWPWRPEQAPGHYAIHALWAVAMLPLIVLSVQESRQDRWSSGESRPI